MWKREYLPRNRGLQADAFSDAMKKAGASNPKMVLETEHGGVPRTPGTDIADPYASILKPKNIPVWDHAPMNDEEHAVYHGMHIHAESNPLGLHSHVMGGKISGGHSHGPQNRFGGHHHKSGAIEMSISIDGSHVHEAGVNHPDGEHQHCPENFG